MYNMHKLRQGYLDHNAHIRKVVPQERLLTFHAKDGWEPLCAFLDVAVPKEPFPNINEGSFVADLHTKYILPAAKRRTAIRLLRMVAPVAIAVVAAWAYRRSS